MLESHQSNTLHAPQASCAFVATSFSFGPVSKAVSIAQELKAQAPQLATHYFGAGIDFDYAKKSDAFDHLFRSDVDQRDALLRLVPQLSGYRAIFSVLNLDLLPLWRREYPPLYFVDSLAWMWPSIPAGIENVAAYFVQDYLMPPARVRQWAAESPLVLVAPIETASNTKPEAARGESNQLLVNFSGCSNPFAPSGLYEKYALILASAILEESSGRFEQINFSCNEKIVRHLRRRFGGLPSVRIEHFTHEDFLRLLATSALVLSAPGITTTLESLALRVPVRFLLPQNDSQALLSERYRFILGDDACMAFSRFGEEFSFPSFLPEVEAVSLALTHLEKILETRQRQIYKMISQLLTVPTSYSLNRLKSLITRRWGSPGQQAIVSHVLSYTFS